MISQASIDRLYSAFGDAPKPKTIEHCPCCMTDAEIETLLSVPVKDLPEELISTYAGNAFHTVGDEEAYHYLFPRLFELLISKGWVSDFEVVLGNLKRADWGLWSKVERESVISIIDEHFDNLARRDDEFSGFEIEGVLCGVARSGLPIAPYLLKLDSPSCTAAFESMVILMSDVHSTGDLSSPYWEEVPEAAAHFLSWLQSDSAKRVLEQKLGMKFGS